MVKGFEFDPLITTLSEHGGKETGLLDFSVSVNPYQPTWKDEVFSEAKRESRLYPYFENLDEDLSTLLDERATVTAGATEAIYLSALLLKKLGVRKVIIPAPTYSEYERISRIFGFRVVKAEVNPNSLAERVERNDAVFFCNPNNPDGRYFSPKELKLLIDVVEDTDSILILDEAFKDFVKGFESPRCDNMIRLRTFTKSYGMPGIRVGYVLGFAREFKAVRMPWSIGCVGKAFMQRVIEDGFAFLKETMPRIWKEKERIENELSVKSDANFFLMKSDANILKSEGILVRDCTSFGLNGYVRFSVRTPEENSKLIAAIRRSAESP